MKIHEEISGTSKQDSLGLRYLFVKSRFRRPPKEGISKNTAVSAHLRNTTAKRRDVAKQLLGRNYADIIAGDFNTTAYRERGEAKVNSIEEVWDETLLILPQDVVPMWSQMKDSGDCCALIPTRSHEPSWRLARHGSSQRNQVRTQKRRISLSTSTSAQPGQQREALAVRPPEKTEGNQE